MKSSRNLSPLLTPSPALPLAARLPPLLLVPWVSLLGVLGLWLLAPRTVMGLMYLPLLLSTVILGIPHGALDHLVPLRLGWNWSRRPRLLLLYIGAYALLAALALGLWWLAPTLTFWGFLLMSLLHWGQGDLHYLETIQARRRSGPWSAPLTLLARGSLPILVPLLAFTDWYGRLASGVRVAFGLDGLTGDGLTGPLLSGAWITGLTWVLGAVLLAYALDTLLSSRRPGLELAETALLLVFFVLVPAPLAIGTYFTLWHAWRHLGRLLSLQPGVYGAVTDSAAGNSASGNTSGNSAATRPPWTSTFRLAVDLVPITLVALGLLAGLYLWAAPHVQDVETFAALYLALIAALTVPHALLVAWMDV